MPRVCVYSSNWRAKLTTKITLLARKRISFCKSRPPTPNPQFVDQSEVDRYLLRVNCSSKFKDTNDVYWMGEFREIFVIAPKGTVPERGWIPVDDDSKLRDAFTKSNDPSESSTHRRNLDDMIDNPERSNPRRNLRKQALNKVSSCRY